jgi:hypothetical protein
MLNDERTDMRIAEKENAPPLVQRLTNVELIWNRQRFPTTEMR